MSHLHLGRRRRTGPLAGASLVTTGQLSNCSFVVREKNGVVECTHLEPKNFNDGVALQDDLKVRIWGRKDHPKQTGVDVRASIFGRRGPHGWEIFGQRSISGTSTVLGIDRFWPPG